MDTTKTLQIVQIYRLCSCGLHHAKAWFWAYADSGGPDQPKHWQSDQGLHCPLTESLATTECMNGKQRP